MLQVAPGGDGGVIRVPAGREACFSSGEQGVSRNASSQDVLSCSARSILIANPPVVGPNGTVAEGLEWSLGVPELSSSARGLQTADALVGPMRQRRAQSEIGVAVRVDRRTFDQAARLCDAGERHSAWLRSNW